MPRWYGHCVITVAKELMPAQDRHNMCLPHEAGVAGELDGDYLSDVRDIDES